MQYTYYLREDTIIGQAGEEHIVYGIEAITPGGETLLAYPDVFFDRGRAEHLVHLCNEGGLSLLHLADVVEDALAEQYAV